MHCDDFANNYYTTVVGFEGKKINQRILKQLKIVKDQNDFKERYTVPNASDGIQH